MKKQLFSKQVCGLLIGAIGALAPLSSQARDELADRYINGYLNDPYTNEVAPERQSVLNQDAKAIKTSDAQGAQGPVREDSAPPAAQPMGQEKMIYRDEPRELYTGEKLEHWGGARGAEGPVRSDAGMSMKPAPQRFESAGELYNPPYPRTE
jgi:hypothetical protein